MSATGTSLSLLAVAASMAAVLAAAIVWLVLTNPVGMADAIGHGQVTPLVKELAGALLGALRQLLQYL